MSRPQARQTDIHTFLRHFMKSVSNKSTWYSQGKLLGMQVCCNV